MMNATLGHVGLAVRDALAIADKLQRDFGLARSDAAIGADGQSVPVLGIGRSALVLLPVGSGITSDADRPGVHHLGLHSDLNHQRRGSAWRPSSGAALDRLGGGCRGARSGRHHHIGPDGCAERGASGCPFGRSSRRRAPTPKRAPCLTPKHTRAGRADRPYRRCQRQQSRHPRYVLRPHRVCAGKPTDRSRSRDRSRELYLRQVRCGAPQPVAVFGRPSRHQNRTKSMTWIFHPPN